MRYVAAGLILVVAIGALAVWQRHSLVFYALSSDGMPPLLEAQDEGQNVRWVDDYFTVQAIDARTYAIGEPRYVQQCYSYLIIGSERALLFDAGPGYFDIRSVAESLTDKPITFLPSHFHFDHTGNEITFDRVAVVDLPYLRERAPDNELALTSDEHLGYVEGVENITLKVDEWVAPGSDISLGGRSLRILYTPGHTEDSISLFDAQANLLFTGDFIYPGPLFAFLRNSGMGDYVAGADTVISSAPETTRVLGAHRIVPPGAPEIVMDDVKDLRAALDEIKAGEIEGQGVFPVVYRVNDKIELWAEPPYLQDWTVPQLLSDKDQ